MGLELNISEQHIKKALPFSRALRLLVLAAWLTRDYVGRTWTFFALSNLEFDLLAFI